MNYYNPYFGSLPYGAVASAGKGLASGGIKGLLGGGIKWGSIINGIQKTLGIANQAIPLIKQVTPVVRNAKTMFRVMNEFKKVDTPISTTASTSVANSNPTSNTTVNQVQPETSVASNTGPTFFL